MTRGPVKLYDENGRLVVDGSLSPAPGGGSLPYTLRVLMSDPIDFDAAGLNDGVDFTTAILGEDIPIGSLIYDVGGYVVTVFDGTTPLGDIGLFQSGDTQGFFGFSGPQVGAGAIDLSQVDTALVAAHGALSGGGQNLLQSLIFSQDIGYLPTRVTAAGPLFVIASQDGLKGGTAVGGATGQLIAYAVVATP